MARSIEKNRKKKKNQKVKEIVQNNRVRHDETGNPAEQRDASEDNMSWRRVKETSGRSLKLHKYDSEAMVENIITPVKKALSNFTLKAAVGASGA